METICVIWYLKNLKTFWGHKNGITNNWFNEWIKHSFLYSSNSYSQLDIVIQFISPNIIRKVRSSTTLISFPLRLVFLLLRGNDKARKDWSPKAHNWKNKNISHKAHVPTQPNWMHEGRTKGLSLIIWVIIAKRDLKCGFKRLQVSFNECRSELIFTTLTNRESVYSSAWQIHSFSQSFPKAALLIPHLRLDRNFFREEVILKYMIFKS